EDRKSRVSNAGAARTPTVCLHQGYANLLPYYVCAGALAFSAADLRSKSRAAGKRARQTGRPRGRLSRSEGVKMSRLIRHDHVVENQMNAIGRVVVIKWQ